MKDYHVAAALFRQLTPSYAKDGWSGLEIEMLERYAQCLKHLKQTEDYVLIGMKALAKMIKARYTSNQWLMVRSPMRAPSHECLDGSVHGLKALLTASKSLHNVISVSLEDYFDHVKLSSYIQHYQDQGVFGLDLRLRSLLPESLEAVSLRAEMVCTNKNQHSKLWLAAQSPQTINPGQTNLMLISKVGSVRDSIGLNSANDSFRTCKVDGSL